MSPRGLRQETPGLGPQEQDVRHDLVGRPADLQRRVADPDDEVGPVQRQAGAHGGDESPGRVPHPALQGPHDGTQQALPGLTRGRQRRTGAAHRGEEAPSSFEGHEGPHRLPVHRRQDPGLRDKALLVAELAGDAHDAVADQALQHVVRDEVRETARRHRFRERDEVKRLPGGPVELGEVTPNQVQQARAGRHPRDAHPDTVALDEGPGLPLGPQELADVEGDAARLVPDPPPRVRGHRPAQRGPQERLRLLRRERLDVDALGDAVLPQLHPGRLAGPCRTHRGDHLHAALARQQREGPRAHRLEQVGVLDTDQHGVRLGLLRDDDGLRAPVTGPGHRDLGQARVQQRQGRVGVARAAGDDDDVVQPSRAGRRQVRRRGGQGRGEVVLEPGDPLGAQRRHEGVGGASAEHGAVALTSIGTRRTVPRRSTGPAFSRCRVVGGTGAEGARRPTTGGGMRTVRRAEGAVRGQRAVDQVRLADADGPDDDDRAPVAQRVHDGVQLVLARDVGPAVARGRPRRTPSRTPTGRPRARGGIALGRTGVVGDLAHGSSLGDGDGGDRRDGTPGPVSPIMVLRGAFYQETSIAQPEEVPQCPGAL